MRLIATVWGDVARVLWCDACRRPVGALVVESKPSCVTCHGPVEWREMEQQPFTLTNDDRLFLKVNRISPE